MAKSAPRTFSDRSGVRVRDSILACDATSGSDLIFLSHAQALDTRAARALPRPRAGKRQILTTETTLALLGTAGERLRPTALGAAFGRPFTVGGMRLELFASGHLPGSASLLADLGSRPVVYAGAVGPGSGPRPQVEPRAIRTAAALCIDATYGSPRFNFPPPDEALADVRDAVLQALSQRQSPVVLVRPFGPALDVASTLAAAGVPLRAHRQVMAAAAAYRQAGLAVPALLRFDGKLGTGEALLWPPEARDAGLLGTLLSPYFVLASPLAADPEAVSETRVDRAIPLSDLAGWDDLGAYIEATAASEVAVRHAPDNALCDALVARGVNAYPLGPPQQIPLLSP